MLALAAHVMTLWTNPPVVLDQEAIMPTWAYEAHYGAIVEQHAAWFGDDKADDAAAREAFGEIVRIMEEVEVEAMGRYRDTNGDSVRPDPHMLFESELYDYNEEDQRIYHAAAEWGMEQLRERGVFERASLLARTDSVVLIQPPEPPLWSPKAEFGKHRLLVRFEWARMALAAADGDWDGYRVALDEASALARHAGHQGNMLSTLVEQGTTNRTHEYVLKDVLSGRLPAAECGRVLEIVRRQRGRDITALLIKRESLEAEAILDLCHTPSGRLLPGNMFVHIDAVDQMMGMVQDLFYGGVADFELPRLRVVQLWNLTGWYFPPRHETEMVLLIGMEKIRAIIDGHPREVAAANERAVAWTESLPALQWFGRFTMNVHTRILPTFCESVADGRMHTQGMMGLLAIEAYRAEHGRVPTTLDELVPAYLDAVPSDPFGDGALGYRVTDQGTGGAAAGPGRGYVLYSVWYDGVDNEGTRVDEQFAQVKPPRRYREGIDWIANDVRSDK